jgi:hypothetical protein
MVQNIKEGANSPNYFLGNMISHACIGAHIHNHHVLSTRATGALMKPRMWSEPIFTEAVLF